MADLDYVTEDKIISIEEELREGDGTIWDRYRVFLEKVAFLACDRLDYLAVLEEGGYDVSKLPAHEVEALPTELTAEEKQELTEYLAQRNPEVLQEEYNTIIELSPNRDSAFLKAMGWLIKAIQE